MLNLFLTASFADVAALLQDAIKMPLQGKTITFIPTASNVEEVKFYVDDDRKALQNLGLLTHDLDIATASYEEIKTTLEHNDYIYVSGGNTFYLLEQMYKSGAYELIKSHIQLGKLYIGASAGSAILAPDISYVHLMDDRQKVTALHSEKGLDCIDCYPLPHFNNVPFVDACNDVIATYQTTLNLCPISNNQVLVMTNDQSIILTQ